MTIRADSESQKNCKYRLGN